MGTGLLETEIILPCEDCCLTLFLYCLLIYSPDGSSAEHDKEGNTGLHK